LHVHDHGVVKLGGVEGVDGSGKGKG